MHTLGSLTCEIIFRPTFPSTCLSPDQPGYGQVVATSGKRKSRRTVQPPALPMHNSQNAPRALPYHPSEPPMYAQPHLPRRISGEISDAGYSYSTHAGYRPASSPSGPPPSSYDRYHQEAPSYPHAYPERPKSAYKEGGGSPIRDRHSQHSRYSPYPSAHPVPRRDYAGPRGAYGSQAGEYEYPPQAQTLHTRSSDSNLRRPHDPHERLTLPPISALAPNLPSPRGAFTLPPLIAPSVNASRGSAGPSDVPFLGRMRLNSADDSEDAPRPSEAYLQQRRSSSAPPLHLAPSRYQPPVRSEDYPRDSHDARPSWAFRSSGRDSAEYDRGSRPDAQRSDHFACSSIRGGPATSPPPSASNSTHGDHSTNEHSPVSPRTPYGPGWESRMSGPPVAGGAIHRLGGRYDSRSREPSRSPEIAPRDSDEGLEAARSPGHSRKSSGHISDVEPAQVARAPLRPW